MNTDLQLCPCCAAHLRVPQQLHAMRCNTCDAELVYIDKGGVRGLALLPDTIAPYSHPAQRPHNFDGRDLLNFRRDFVLRSAANRQARWGGLFFVTVGLLVATGVLGLLGAGGVTSGPREKIEVSALAFLGSLAGLPILAYAAMYFQGRARLARESVRRWM